MTNGQESCELCAGNGGELLVRRPQYRVVLVEDARYPGFCRVVWNAHVREMSDLSDQDRGLLMQAVWQVEAAVREVMRPHKLNLASLGNVTPHLHWHVIPRYRDDAHFPDPVWASLRREPAPEALAERAALLPALREALKARFA